jgi:hypothetical protein
MFAALPLQVEANKHIDNYFTKIYENEKLELLAMTNFYFGVSYINTGNIHKGAYYLGLAAKNSTSKAESDYVDSVIDKISSYL